MAYSFRWRARTRLCEVEVILACGRWNVDRAVVAADALSAGAQPVGAGPQAGEAEAAVLVGGRRLHAHAAGLGQQPHRGTGHRIARREHLAAEVDELLVAGPVDTERG